MTLCFLRLRQVEVRLQQHLGGPHPAPQPHVVLVQHQTAPAEPEGLQDRVQDQAAGPDQGGPGQRATCPGEPEQTEY